jgi:hypothetical protein
MSIDYTDLNKHGPKDPFGLSRVDKVVDQRPDANFFPFLTALWLSPDLFKSGR